jgi:dimethylargininase
LPRLAITREISPNFGRCELTYLARDDIDVDRARIQHRIYEETLANLGCEIHSLPAKGQLPDCVFVEDTCIVLDELAIIARPGAQSRRPEVHAVAEFVSRYRKLHFIESLGTIDGGDVLRLGRSLFVGLSRRSNASGIEQIRRLLEPLGYQVWNIEVNGCLHLKSAVSRVAERAVLLSRTCVDPDPFKDYDIIDVDPSEPMAANALLVGTTVVYPAAYPRTRERLEARGIRVQTLDVSELAKAEGGVTCCSVIFDA